MLSTLRIIALHDSLRLVWPWPDITGGIAFEVM